MLKELSHYATALGLLCVLSLPLMGQTTSSKPALETPNAAVEARINTLLKQMTLEEKAGQLNQYTAGALVGPGTGRTNYDEMIAKGQISSLMNVVTAKETNAFQKIAVEKSRLHIPILFGLDVIHGFRAVYPQPLGFAATWDIPLIEDATRMAAKEASEQGVRWVFSPMVDISRDARWGRIAESAGEDPYLGSLVARAYVRGYQGKSFSDPGAVLSTAKHYVGYGAAEGGRDYNTTEISEGLLRQVYLAPFHAAEQEGIATFMSAFNSLNGVPTSANQFTLTQVLRKEWGFKGVVVSDWSSIRETIAHGTGADEATATRKAFMAGVDMDMESNLYLTQLPALVKSGAVPMARLDEAVRRVLRLKILLGLFENPYVDEAKAAHAEIPAEHLDLVRRAAEESFVLLKNAPVAGNPLLPLNAPTGKKIALLGPLADDPAQMLGSWSAQGKAADVVTLRTSLQERAAQNQMTVSYAKGVEIEGTDESGIAEAVQLAQQADVVILTLGEVGIHTGEAASRAYLNLPAAQQKLMESVVATGKPVVLVLFNGRPLTITWAADHVPAILEAWFPGIQAGPALVRTLFGEATPSGRLTATFPRTVGQEPLYYNAQSTGRPPAPDLDLTKPPAEGGASKYVSRYMDETNAPLYPFGSGLSYTTFSYSPASVSVASISAKSLNGGAGSLTVSADVKNTGSRKAVETAQLYIRLRGTSVARPVRELKGFQRVELAPGESKHVEFKIGKEELSFWNIDMKNVVEPADLSVWIAPDSAQGTAAEVKITE